MKIRWGDIGELKEKKQDRPTLRPSTNKTIMICQNTDKIRQMAMWAFNPMKSKQQFKITLLFSQKRMKLKQKMISFKQWIWILTFSWFVVERIFILLYPHFIQQLEIMEQKLIALGKKCYKYCKVSGCRFHSFKRFNSLWDWNGHFFCFSGCQLRSQGAMELISIFTKPIFSCLVIGGRTLSN